jgi:hypothetical protein
VKKTSKSVSDGADVVLSDEDYNVKMKDFLPTLSASETSEDLQVKLDQFEEIELKQE